MYVSLICVQVSRLKLYISIPSTLLFPNTHPPGLCPNTIFNGYVASLVFLYSYTDLQNEDTTKTIQETRRLDNRAQIKRNYVCKKKIENSNFY